MWEASAARLTNELRFSTHTCIYPVAPPTAYLHGWFNPIPLHVHCLSETTRTNRVGHAVRQVMRDTLCAYQVVYLIARTRLEINSLTE